MRKRSPAPEDPVVNDQDQTLERVGDLLLCQPKQGYRYGLDSFLLVHFTEPRKGEKVLDLGTGCGIIALLMTRLWPTLRMWGVELQEELAALASRNAVRNALESRCTILTGDIRRMGRHFNDGFFDRVVANPPFRPPRSGRICPLPQRALARQELALPFKDLAATAARLLRHGGGLDLIHLPERLPELFEILKTFSLEPKRLRLVHSFTGSPPEMALLSSRKGGRPGLKVEAPLLIFSAPGVYTAEARRALRIPGGQ